MKKLDHRISRGLFRQDYNLRNHVVLWRNFSKDMWYKQKRNLIFLCYLSWSTYVQKSYSCARLICALEKNNLHFLLNNIHLGLDRMPDHPYFIFGYSVHPSFFQTLLLFPVSSKANLYSGICCIPSSVNCSFLRLPQILHFVLLVVLILAL